MIEGYQVRSRGGWWILWKELMVAWIVLALGLQHPNAGQPSGSTQPISVSIREAFLGNVSSHLLPSFPWLAPFIFLPGSMSFPSSWKLGWSEFMPFLHTPVPSSLTCPALVGTLHPCWAPPLSRPSLLSSESAALEFSVANL